MLISHWGRADARVQVFHPPADGALLGSTHVFMGASGEYLGAKPRIGTQPSAGSVAVELVAPLHFGNFAGLLSKIVWVSLGMALCYVSITGLQLWLERRASEPLWRGMAPAVDIVALGTPIGLAGAAYGFFFSYGVADTHAFTLYGFIAFCLASVALGIALPARRRVQGLEMLLALALALLPAARMGLGGSSWAEALHSGNALVVGVDILLLLTATTYGLFALRRQMRMRGYSGALSAAA